jgi:hypothetical protein
MLLVIQLHLIGSVGHLGLGNAWFLLLKFLSVDIFVLVVATQLLVTHLLFYIQL